MEKLRTVPDSKVLPLHANLTSDEQRRVFASTPEWKIIVSTNVAEVRVQQVIIYCHTDPEMQDLGHY